MGRFRKVLKLQRNLQKRVEMFENYTENYTKLAEKSLEKHEDLKKVRLCRAAEKFIVGGSQFIEKFSQSLPKLTPTF